ncbi:leptin receptor isoform X2 [Pseudochaenichthys georgianus]|uniref:leptin receptor isoform X2 n=1 Tax=Pseudochaenichthys georgianus TaxID=52239 RepID=UPI00146E640C|nr:leptin receptor isoform X2 [Pseudochaenichthys georgianus]
MCICGVAAGLTPAKAQLGNAPAMTTTMVWRMTVTVLMQIFLVSNGALSLGLEEGASLQSGAMELPWQDELCCDSPSAHLTAEVDSTHTPETNRSDSNPPHHPLCSFRSSTNRSHPPDPSEGTCLDILCKIDENWENLICELQSHGPPSTTKAAGVKAISLQSVSSKKEENDANTPYDNPVICNVEVPFMCLVVLDATTSFVTVVTVSLTDAIPPSVLLRIPSRPVRLSPPVNLSHIQTIKAELILQWDDPPHSDAGRLRYEVRHSPNTTHPAWQVVSVSEEPRLSLELKPELNYTIQVRSSSLDKPPLWSEWSERHHIYLYSVSYIPQTVVARSGENVTMYCVFNDHSINASTATWMLNLNPNQALNRSLYHPLNQWVSKITFRPSETQMYAVLQCKTKNWTQAQSRIYVEGAYIKINCETSGDIDAMECSWTNTLYTNPKIRYRWADLPCDVMEKREQMGEEVGQTGPPWPSCLPCLRTMKTKCTFQPLRMNCYKLWLEVPSLLGPIRSKPIYLTPTDHVKPHTPINVKAVTQSSGVLNVTWEPPSLPSDGLQCQFRYQSPSAVRAQPEWKVQSPVRERWAEAVVSDMCRVYVVQARCMHTKGTGYWSEWSDSVYSTPQNSRAPERGPDFWRILQDDPHRNQTNVTLLLEPLQISMRSYCVDGFIVQYQPLSGSVRREQMELASSYSFQWNQVPQTVTVEAYNNLGSSANNINMTLEKQPKRRCVHSFSVLVINSTCVSLSWSLLDPPSVPLYMVVQWSPQRQQGYDPHKGRSSDTWARLPYTKRPIYLRGNFLGSEDSGFQLYPVFADGEGEPMYAKVAATREDPAAYMMLMIISFLSIVLLVTLILSQNQMKKIVWKKVPNPNQCSWAKGLDFKKGATFDLLFRPSEGLSTWPLPLPSENISKASILDKTDLSAMNKALVQAPCVSLTPAPAFSISLTPGFDTEAHPAQPSESEGLLSGTSLALNVNTISQSIIDELLLPDQTSGSNDSSTHSLVTYATVLLSGLKQEQQPSHLHYKDGSGNSSSDEGNFSTNNSDISGPFVGGLWELDSCRGGEMDDLRLSCLYNSVEELSETSDQEHKGEEEVRGIKDFFHLEMDFPAADEKSEKDEQTGEETNIELLKNVVLNRDERAVELHPLLGPEDSRELQSASARGFSQLYQPQFRTAACMRQLAAHPQDG